MLYHWAKSQIPKNEIYLYATIVLLKNIYLYKILLLALLLQYSYHRKAGCQYTFSDKYFIKDMKSRQSIAEEKSKRVDLVLYFWYNKLEWVVCNGRSIYHTILEAKKSKIRWAVGSVSSEGFLLSKTLYVKMVTFCDFFFSTIILVVGFSTDELEGNKLWDSSKVRSTNWKWHWFIDLSNTRQPK